MNSNDNLRLERLALLIGTMIGQINELLNQIQNNDKAPNDIYKSLLDINKMASLQIHEIYYKE
jgi:hypothetical protein